MPSLRHPALIAFSLAGLLEAQALPASYAFDVEPSTCPCDPTSPSRVGPYYYGHTPVIGRTFVLAVVGCRPDGFLFSSVQRFTPGIRLHQFGLPGCTAFLYPDFITRVDHYANRIGPGANTTLVYLPLPGSMSLVGTVFYQQAMFWERHVPGTGTCGSFPCPGPYFTTLSMGVIGTH
jgi:hypothetical protein